MQKWTKNIYYYIEIINLSLKLKFRNNAHISTQTLRSTGVGHMKREHKKKL